MGKVKYSNIILAVRPRFSHNPQPQACPSGKQSPLMSFRTDEPFVFFEIERRKKGFFVADISFILQI